MGNLARMLAAATIVAVALAGCSSTGSDTTTSSGTTASATGESGKTSSTTTPDTIVPPELDGIDIDMVVVGGRLMLLAIADSPTLRAKGLMGVTDLADLDGMLFYWRHEADGGFWMKDTVIPLDIVFFAEDGSYVGRASMTPCRAEPCPIYSPGSDIDYRFAIEARPGDLDWVDASTVIEYTD